MANTVLRFETKVDDGLSQERLEELSDYIQQMIVELPFITSVDAVYPLRNVGTNQKKEGE
jgi:hypothetical protein